MPPPDEPPPTAPSSPAEAVAEARIKAPTRGNRRLDALLEAANADPRLKAWWYMQQVFANRLGMSDHSWVHVQIVLNIALRLFRLLSKAGVQPAMVGDHGMRDRDAEVVIASGCLFHDTGMSTAQTTRPTACSWRPSGCRSCSTGSTTSPTAPWWWRSRCTRSSGTAAAATR